MTLAVSRARDFNFSRRFETVGGGKYSFHAERASESAKNYMLKKDTALFEGKKRI